MVLPRAEPFFCAFAYFVSRQALTKLWLPAGVPCGGTHVGRVTVITAWAANNRSKLFHGDRYAAELQPLRIPL